MKKIELVLFWWYGVFGAYLMSDSLIKAARNDEASVSAAPDQNTPTPVNLQSLSSEEKKKFFDSFDTIMTDCGGVLYNSKGAIQNAHRAVDELRNRGKTIYFVTNTTKPRSRVMKRFKNYGFTNIDDDSVICTAGLLLDYLRDRLPADKVVYIIAHEYVCEGLLENNIGCFGGGKDDMDLNSMEDISRAQYKTRNDVGAVVIGVDLHVNYHKIAKAFTYLQDENCLFVALHAENVIPIGSNRTLPGAGATVAAIRAATGREPFILGKPGTYLLDMLKRLGDPQRTLFIGDRMDTDVLTGHKCSFRSLLVLTGLHNLRDIEKYAGSDDPEKKMCVPDYYTDAFSDLAFK